MFLYFPHFVVKINQAPLSIQGNSILIEQEFDELLESVDFEYYLIPEFSDSLLFDYSCVTMHYHPVDITLTTSWVI